MLTIYYLIFHSFEFDEEMKCSCSFETYLHENLINDQLFENARFFITCTFNLFELTRLLPPEAHLKNIKHIYMYRLCLYTCKCMLSKIEFLIMLLINLLIYINC